MHISFPKRNILILHFTILIWGFTGILGELISISALPLVWYRVVIAAVALYVYMLFRRQSMAISLKKENPVFIYRTGGRTALGFVFSCY